MSDLAERIEFIIERLKVSQRELARMSGLKEPHIGLIINRLKKNPKANVENDTLLAIAKGAGVSPGWLLSGEGPSGLPGDELPADLTPQTPPAKSDTRPKQLATHWAPMEVEGWVGEALQRPDHPIYSGEVITASKVLVRDRTMKMDPEHIVEFAAQALAAAYDLEKTGMLGDPEDEATKSDILSAMIKPPKVAPRPGRASSAAELTAKAKAALADRGHEPDPSALARRKAADARAARKGKG